MIRKYSEIFCWKNVSSFCSAKATHIFSAKNFRILCIESAKTVNEMTLNDIVKLTKLWTTGPSLIIPDRLASDVMIALYRDVELPCLTCPTCPNSLRTSEKYFSIYLSWDKDFTALAKKSIQIMRYYFFSFLEEKYVLGTHKKHLAVALPLCTHYICFLREIRKM